MLPGVAASGIAEAAGNSSEQANRFEMYFYCLPPSFSVMDACLTIYDYGSLPYLLN